MRQHLAYLKYIIRHKYFVFLAGTKIPYCSWFRLLVHDLTKFFPSEWNAYVYTFYAKDGSKQYKPNNCFDHAWLHHQHRNKHHWQSITGEWEVIIWYEKNAHNIQISKDTRIIVERILTDVFGFRSKNP
jgi:hypothetical protein